jgi:hypothetical protein
MLRRSFFLGLCAGSLSLFDLGTAHAALPQTDDLGKGRYARMTMRLEKTFLNIDVLDLEIRLDEETAAVLESIVKGKKHSKELEQRVVDAVLATTNAYAGIRFLRGVTFNQFVEGGQASARRAYEAKLISQAEYVRVRDGLARWFAPLKDRGIRQGDRFHYRGRSSGLRTLVADADGKKLIEVTQEGASPLHTMLANYFTPGGDFREPLVRSLFDASGGA